MKKKLIVLSGLVLGLAPSLALAAVTDKCADFAVLNAGTITTILCRIGNLLNLVIPIAVVIGLILFVWGVVTYVIGSDEEAKTKGRDRMIYGIIGLAVIVAVWGLVNILLNSLGIDEASAPRSVTLPTL